MKSWSCRRACFWIAGALAVGEGLAACGSRTGLLAPEIVTEIADATPDDSVVPDQDATVDIPDTLPSLDVTVRPDVIRINDCPDAAATLIYLVTSQHSLLSFFPPTHTFRRIGTIACRASTPGANPFSMAVDRKGTAYVLYDDGELFRVSTATAACTPTSFSIGKFTGFTTFGMGFAADDVGGGETLYIAADSNAGGPKPALGIVDTTTFSTRAVGPFTPTINRAELTGTGGGQLFAFYSDLAGGRAGSFVGEIDKATAHVVGEDPLPNVNQGNGWAFAFWGGDFYLFTGPGTNSAVTRFNPADKSTARVAFYPELIVGAGVSTCAPQ